MTKVKNFFSNKSEFAVTRGLLQSLVKFGDDALPDAKDGGCDFGGAEAVGNAQEYGGGRHENVGALAGDIIKERYFVGSQGLEFFV